MNPLELKTLICDQCGKQLRPQQDTLLGVTVVNDQRVRYMHPPVKECPHSEEVYEYWVWPANLPDGRLVGKMDWKELPAKLVKR